MVVLDHFSKSAHFGSLPHNFTASQTVVLFTSMICKLGGYLEGVISNTDPIFMGKFWWTLFQLNCTKLRMSTTYHPQTDGQTEVVNRCLQQFCVLLCILNQKKWGNYLRWDEWNYNTSIHNAIGLTPFQVVYGRNPPSISSYIRGSSNIEAVGSTLTTMEEILDFLRNNF